MDGVVRRGPLTAQSLTDAVVAEREGGRHPQQVAVGSRLLEARAMQVLAPGDGAPLDDLRGVVPNVIVDPLLPDNGWELRER